MLLKCEDVQGKNVLTNFHGMDFTTDKLRSLVRKWFSLIETFVDIKTTDQYMLRIFVIGFTKRRMDQAKRTCYAQSGQIRQIRKKMNEIVARESTTCDLKELVLKFIPEVIGKEIEKVCAGIYPLQNVYIRKVKILKAPKFDVTKLMEVTPHTLTLPHPHPIPHTPHPTPETIECANMRRRLEPPAVQRLHGTPGQHGIFVVLEGRVQHQAVDVRRPQVGERHCEGLRHLVWDARGRVERHVRGILAAW